MRIVAAARPVRCASTKSLQCFRADQRRVAWKNDGEARISCRSSRTRDQHRVARAVLRPLQHGGCAQRRNGVAHVFGLVPHDDENILCKRLAGAHDMLDERTTAGAMQHLGQVGFQPRAFTRGENHDVQIVRCHEAFIVAFPPPFGNHGASRNFPI